MSYPAYTLNFKDATPVSAAAGAGSTGGRGVTSAPRDLKIGVKGSHTALMDIGGTSFEINISHHNEFLDREPILDIVFTRK